jgi:DNA-binding beta-propeller fold protein YncE
MSFRRPFSAALVTAVLVTLSAGAGAGSHQGVVGTVPRMPAVPDPANLYSETRAGQLSPQVAKHLHRIYIPSRTSNSVSVMDPATMTVVEILRMPARPRFVAPSWDLNNLWVVSHTPGRTDGNVTPIDASSGKLGSSIPVDSPHNLYWSPDGRHAIVVARELKRLDFRDVRSMTLEYSIATPDCAGISHGEISISGRFAAFTCEEGGSVTKIDLVNRRVVTTVKVSSDFKKPEGQQPAAHSMPQDMRISPDGLRLYVSDLAAGGLHVLDFSSFRQIKFIPTGAGAHGLYPSRDGASLYVANRGSHGPEGRRPAGSVSVVDFATGKVTATWIVPGGGSPDMGTVSADGKHLWLAGRHDAEVYRFDTSTGAVTTLKLAHEPHGLLVWPQPGRYSLGYTGLLR